MLRRVLCSTSFVALSAAALVAGCGKGDKGADSVKTDTMATAAATTPAPAPAPTMTDENIAAILDEANAADSAGGKMAQTKGTSADVKDFGKTMMNDHHALRKAGQDLVKKLGVTPAAPAGDTLPQHAQKMSDSLNALAKGPAWDKAYIDHEVAMHQAVIAIAQDAMNAAKAPELKDLLTKAAPNLQAHLDRAKSIQSKLGGGAGAGAGDTTKKTP